MIVFDENKQQYYSTLIQSEHGFLTRNGTVNIPESVTRTNCFWVQQVHGNVVLTLNNETDFGRVTTKEADGLIYKKTQHDKVALSIRTADCVPIIMEDAKHQLIGIVHSGWKGCNLNITAAAVKKLLLLGSTLNDITVAIGPSIGSCCYDINLERQLTLRDSFDEFLENREGMIKFNLVKTVILQLGREGIKRECIDWKFFCTRCQNDRFTSYRRNGKGVTNMISYIAI
jgi:polyphenol oxidase